MMAHCDKPVKRTQVNSVEECIQCYDGGGANQFSSWELVNQFSDSDKLQWDHQEQAYWVGPVVSDCLWMFHLFVVLCCIFLTMKEEEEEE